MYEASLEIVGFVLLHKVPKNRLPDGGFEIFRPIVNFRLIDSRNPSREVLVERAPFDGSHAKYRGSSHHSFPAPPAQPSPGGTSRSFATPGRLRRWRETFAMQGLWPWPRAWRLGRGSRRSGTCGSLRQAGTTDRQSSSGR